MKRYEEFIKENNIDPYNEEIWDDIVVFNRNDVKTLIENGFDIEPYQHDVDEDWNPEQSAVKHEQIGKEFCRIEITKEDSDPVRYHLHINSLQHVIHFNDYELEKSLYHLNRVINRGDRWYIKE